MLNLQQRTAYGEDHHAFRDAVRRVFERHMLPNMGRWEAQGVVDRDFWVECGRAGLLCPSVPEAYGGAGLDYRFNAVVVEELAYAGSSAGLTLQSDVTCGYIEQFGSEAQKQRYLPGMVSGELIVAIAMTEPGTGSDLRAIRTTARRDGGDYVLNGSKTYITNGQLADMVIVVAQTPAEDGKARLSLFCVDASTAGFSKGRNLDKIGQHAADTSELFFDNVRVPGDAMLGDEGAGFGMLMSQLPQERLSIAIYAQAAAQRAFDEAVAFTRDRPAFGRPVIDFQNTRFTLATIAAELQLGWAHIDWALQQHVLGMLTDAQGAAAKLWHTEMQWRTVDAALQLHGGAGYMNETMIARLWRDARVQRILGGTSEIMREVIGRTL